MILGCFYYQRGALKITEGNLIVTLLERFFCFKVFSKRSFEDAA